MIICEKCNAAINEDELFCSMCGTVVICDNEEGIINDEHKEFLLSYAEKKSHEVNGFAEATKILEKIKDYKNANELLSYINIEFQKGKQRKLLIIFLEVALLLVPFLLTSFSFDIEFGLCLVSGLGLTIYNIFMIYSYHKKELNKKNYIPNITILILSLILSLILLLLSLVLGSLLFSLIYPLLMLSIVIRSIKSYKVQIKEYKTGQQFFVHNYVFDFILAFILALAFLISLI